jgi:23S rRNA (guanosine2251-2'-O)-methyltransferase
MSLWRRLFLLRFSLMNKRGDKRRARFHDDRRPPHRRDDGRGAPAHDRNAHQPHPPERAHSENNVTRTDLVWGLEPVRELLAAAPGAIRTLYVRTGDGERFEDEMDRVRIAGGQVAFAEEAEIARNCGRDARHQGIAAVVREYEYIELEDMLDTKPDPLLLIDGVTDPRNLGAILRSAEGAGVGNIVIAKDHTVGMTSAAIKSSAGAWIHLKIARCGNVARLMEDLKEGGYWIAALAPGGDTSIYKLDVTSRLAIVIGSEGKGIREIVRKTADHIVDIPMRGKVASLNVSVATAVALYEIARRRGESPGQSSLS